MFVRIHRQDLREHTECVRSAPVVSQTQPSINVYLQYMLERVLLGIVLIIDTFIPYHNWSISIFNASLNYAIVAVASEQQHNP